MASVEFGFIPVISGLTVKFRLTGQVPPTFPVGWDFGDSKEEGFYNVIDKLKKQCIIVTKDFITKGQLRLNEIDKLTCGVYRIRKADNFDSKNMATIRTLVEKVK